MKQPLLYGSLTTTPNPSDTILNRPTESIAEQLEQITTAVEELRLLLNIKETK